MRLTQDCRCDVLVVGAGIAGISAALEAAALGRRVILISSAQIFSGSSFYPGTWGLGLIGPADDGDRADLAETIQTVGCGMADPVMVRTFVDGIRPAIQRVRDMGVRLRRANQGGEKEYIPCFDHKHRDWNGIEFDSAREVFSRRIEELGIQAVPNCELLELAVSDGAVCGAVIAANGQPCYVGCDALVLATGGYGGIYRYHLCTEDVTGVAQALALKAGCQLVNMEFLQMMSGYLSPAPKTIYNERTFRFTRFHSTDGTELFPDTEQWHSLLEERSTYGPFTSRLPSREVDFAIFRAFLADRHGVSASYSRELREHPPEFVTTYFDWLKEAKGLTMEDTVHLGVFAHAANGGIQIAPDASTGVPGLFACGEVTGGMHGADRIGGLSTANGLVFGGIAGRSAARFHPISQGPDCWEFDFSAVTDSDSIREELRDLMFQYGMVLRSGHGLGAGLDRLDALQTRLVKTPAQDMRRIIDSRRLEGQLLTARCILLAALLRRESRGAHYREDYPTADASQARPIEIAYQSGELLARFREG